MENSETLDLLKKAKTKTIVLDKAGDVIDPTTGMPKGANPMPGFSKPPQEMQDSVEGTELEIKAVTEQIADLSGAGPERAELVAHLRQRLATLRTLNAIKAARMHAPAPVGTEQRYL